MFYNTARRTNMLKWKETGYQPVGEPWKGLGVWEAKVKGHPTQAPCDFLSFLIVATEKRFKQYRPHYAVADGYILVINNQDVFSGSLLQCKEVAQLRADRFLDKFGGKFPQDLLVPVWTGE
jgi:hypothetical protein